MACERPNLTIVLRESLPCGRNSTDTSEFKQQSFGVNRSEKSLTTYFHGMGTGIRRKEFPLKDKPFAVIQTVYRVRILE